MINFSTLYSSSSGNCTLISDGDTNILIDAGVSCAKIIAALSKVGVMPEEIDAILVTHEHSDHISGIRVFSKRYNTPIYANAAVMEYILNGTSDIRVGKANIISPMSTFDIRSLKIKAFPTPHDSVSPVGYSVLAEGKKYCVCTDTGTVTKSMLVNLSGSEAVVIEANHDEMMLKKGAYPYSLKKRILSDSGHLSNDKCAWLATQLAIWGTKKIILGHLSEHNNTEEKAFLTVKNMLENNGIKVGTDILLKVAHKDEVCSI